MESEDDDYCTSMDEENVDDTIVEEKIDALTKILKQSRKKLQSYSLNPAEAERVVATIKLQKLREVHEDVSRKLARIIGDEDDDDIERSVPHAKLLVDGNYATQHPKEFKIMIPVLNKFLRDEAYKEGGSITPHVTDIQQLIKHVLPRLQKSAVQQLAGELVESVITLPSKSKSNIPWDRWMQMGQHVYDDNNLPADLLHELNENAKTANKAMHTKLNAMLKDGSTEVTDHRDDDSEADLTSFSEVESCAVDSDSDSSNVSDMDADEAEDIKMETFLDDASSGILSSDEFDCPSD